MKEYQTTKIAYFLLTSRYPRSTQEIVDAIGCNRKTVYQALDSIEDAGFITTVIKEVRKPNRYLVRLTEET